MSAPDLEKIDEAIKAGGFKDLHGLAEKVGVSFESLCLSLNNGMMKGYWALRLGPVDVEKRTGPAVIVDRGAEWGVDLLGVDIGGFDSSFPGCDPKELAERKTDEVNQVLTPFFEKATKYDESVSTLLEKEKKLDELTEILQNDVAELLRALELGDHARPLSPRGLVQTEIIPRCRELVTKVRAAEEENEKLNREINAYKRNHIPAAEIEADLAAKDILDGDKSNLRLENYRLRQNLEAKDRAADGLAKVLKESPGCGRPVSEALRLASGMLFGHGGGPVQQDLDLIADAIDSALKDYDAARGKEPQQETPEQSTLREIAGKLCPFLESIAIEADKVHCVSGQIRHAVARVYPKCRWPKERENDDGRPKRI